MKLQNKKNLILGERRIIEIIENHLDMPKMPVPFGDDVSAYDLGEKQLAILKTDMLVDKTDVPRGMSLWQAARKAVVMNISDFAAKGVKPLAILVSLGLKNTPTEEEIVEIARGLNTGAKEYGTHIFGGDTSESSDLVISLSVFGITQKDKLMLRSGAEPGDIVAVTGCFGKTAAGLKILLGKAKASRRINKPLIDSVLLPRARLKEGLALSQTKAVTASIDSSDGLAWSLYEISRAGKVGFVINRIPVAEEVKEFANVNNLDPLELALYGGEEYELVITLKPELYKKAERSVKKIGGKLWPIGKVTAKNKIVAEIGDKKQTIEPRGYEHFKQNRI